MAGQEKRHAIGPPYHAIVRSLESLENDETLLIQSGKPVGILRTPLDGARGC